MEIDGVLYLIEGGRGLCNIFTNIVLLLIWINTTNKFKKLVVILSRRRKDDITKYCNEINNEKLSIVDHYPKELGKNRSISTTKSYLDGCYWSSIYPTLKNNLLTGKELRDPIMLYFSIFPNKDQLLGVKKYFNPQLNGKMGLKIQELQKDKNNYVAIHVRMTDFVTEIIKTTHDKISYDKFYKFIDDSNCENIYLATDNKDTQQEFVKRYGSRVFYCEELSDEKTKLGGNMRFTSSDAVYLDLFMCRDAAKFMGTYKSTFSDFIKILRFNKNYKYE